ncbi:MAG: cysteine hydrolase [Desulfosporosinus sp.]|nr:cysteine hydrolase [Desulfosporosinus sp.]
MGKTAFLIIDMQKDFCLPEAPFEVTEAITVVPYIKRALDACRIHRIPIFHVFRYYRADGSDVELTRYDDFIKAGGGCVQGTKGAEILDELEPIEGEYLIIKQRWSAFFQTELDCLLKRLGIEQIVVTGVQTPNCIRSTVWDANSLDYEVIVLTDGTGAKSTEIHNANLIDMKNIGIKLMTTDELIKSLPIIPKENLRQKIQFKIERNKTKLFPLR